jgi:hypothetical protein
VSGKRLVIGVIVMGIALPLTLFYLLALQTFGQLFAIAACTFLTWGVTDFLANILERPRLQNRTPGGAIREDWERRQKE